MLVGTDLSKSYSGKFALRGAHIQVAPGSAVMVLGRNGSGKSTLLNILALTLAPDGGAVRVDELSGRAARAALGFAPQEIALFEELSVEENLRCWGRAPSRRTGERIAELIEKLGLGAERRKLLRKLSGGQKRRVNLAAALICEPRYLLLDEPLAGVDEESEGRILEMLAQYRQQGCGLVIASHQPRLLRGLANQALVLDRGETSFCGAAEDYFAALKEREL